MLREMTSEDLAMWEARARLRAEYEQAYRSVVGQVDPEVATDLAWRTVYGGLTKKDG